ncbi:inhibitor of the pro-sigma K processing machinery [Paenibacillus algorifonticola]|uniref:Inhibitor of the pro-sigma K processing machinery n=1 Tax=Paenibacillus algorifonticola TaxID=684063 RepID=A0A1I2HA73_9BACL|nr:pro-sigmaK processing inhibitor BofA family protein [Paenibacillus algorifonticola]SFF25521.1 inhibitor of the pro-sigma K processing machinery [Paenibacillus algorifonticola]
MMNTVLLVVLVVSSITLLAIIIRHRLSWSWAKSFALHLICACAVLYLLNYSGLISDIKIPINPATISTVVVLGVPGIALIVGLQHMMV